MGGNPPIESAFATLWPAQNVEFESLWKKLNYNPCEATRRTASQMFLKCVSHSLVSRGCLIITHCRSVSVVSGFQFGSIPFSICLFLSSTFAGFWNPKLSVLSRQNQQHCGSSDLSISFKNRKSQSSSHSSISQQEQHCFSHELGKSLIVKPAAVNWKRLCFTRHGQQKLWIAPPLVPWYAHAHPWASSQYPCWSITSWCLWKKGGVLNLCIIVVRSISDWPFLRWSNAWRSMRLVTFYGFVCRPKVEVEKARGVLSGMMWADESRNTSRRIYTHVYIYMYVCVHLCRSINLMAEWYGTSRLAMVIQPVSTCCCRCCIHRGRQKSLYKSFTWSPLYYRGSSSHIPFPPSQQLHLWSEHIRWQWRVRVEALKTYLSPTFVIPSSTNSFAVMAGRRRPAICWSSNFAP